MYLEVFEILIEYICICILTCFLTEVFKFEIPIFEILSKTYFNNIAECVCLHVVVFAIVEIQKYASL